MSTKTQNESFYSTEDLKAKAIALLEGMGGKTWKGCRVYFENKPEHPLLPTAKSGKVYYDLKKGTWGIGNYIGTHHNKYLPGKMAFEQLQDDCYLLGKANDVLIRPRFCDTYIPKWAKEAGAI